MLAKIRKMFDLLKYLYRDLPAKLNHLDDSIIEMNNRLVQLQQKNEALFLNQDKVSARLEKYEESIADSSISFSNELDEYKKKVDSLADNISAANNSLSQIRKLLSVYDFYNPELSLLPEKHTDRKRVLVVGFYGGYNLGDEMMLQTLLGYLFKDTDLDVTVMLSENDSYEVYQNGKINIIHYSRNISDYSHLSSYYDALVVGGGALLDDNAYMQSNNHFLSLATTVVELPLYFKAQNKPVLMLGLSTNSHITNRGYIEKLSKCIAASTYFSLRDTYSFETLKSAEIDTEKVEIIDDIVLANPILLDCDSVQLSKDTGIAENPVIAITWVNIYDYANLLVNLIEKTVSSIPGVRIKLIPTYIFNNAEIVYFQSVLRELSDDAAGVVSIEDYPYTIQNFIGILNSVDAVINVKYHGAVLTGCLGIPQTVLVMENHPHYGNKMKWVRDMFGSTSDMLNINSDLDEIVYSVHKNLLKERGDCISKDRIEHNISEITTALKLLEN